MGAIADTKAQFEKQLMPEDILHLRATSMTIMQDPICEVPPHEVERCVRRIKDPLADLPVWHPQRISSKLTQPFRSHKEDTKRLSELITERLNNEELCQVFGIDQDFNMQVYWMILHAWLLHQRFVLEGAKVKKLDEDLFESCWTTCRNWMWLKKVPEYRFDAELQHIQEFMLGCCLALDKALERPDILPARLQQVLWANIYSGSVRKDAATLRKLTKYVLRQLGLVLQLDADVVVKGHFVWADFPLDDSSAAADKAPRKARASPERPQWRKDWRKAQQEA